MSTELPVELLPLLRQRPRQGRRLGDQPGRRRVGHPPPRVRRHGFSPRWSALMNTTPTTYTIRVDGHLDDHWSAWLGEHDLTRPRRRHHHRHRLGRRPNAAPWCTRPPARHRRRPHRAPHHRRPGNHLPVGAQAPAAHRAPHPPARDRRQRRRDLDLPPARVGQPVGHRLPRRPRRLPQVVLGACPSRDHGHHHHQPRPRRPDHRRPHAPPRGFLDNDTSWRLMERVGMRRELHTVRGSLHRSGRWLETVGYAILNEEWPPTEPPRSSS